MNIVSALTTAVMVTATPEEMRNKEVMTEKFNSEQPFIFGTDVLGDLGIKVHFLDEPLFYTIHENLVKCVIRVKVTVAENLARIANVPTEMERTFTGYAKCSDEDLPKFDLEFGQRIAMNKAKISAYLYYQKKFVKIAESLHREMSRLIGFGKKMQDLINGNARYIFNMCESKYPEHADEQDNASEAQNENGQSAKVVKM
jgi:hypothetical protein